MGTLQKLTEEFQRTKLQEILDQLTIEQQNGFYRIFPNGVKSVPTSKLSDAYDLCERTKGSPD